MNIKCTCTQSWYCSNCYICWLLHLWNKECTRTNSNWYHRCTINLE